MKKKTKRIISVILMTLIIFSESSTALAKSNIASSINGAYGYFANLVNSLNKGKSNDNELAESNHETEAARIKNEEELKKKEKLLIKESMQTPGPDIKKVTRISQKQNLIEWDLTGGVMRYEIEVDGDIFNVGEKTFFNHWGLNHNVDHTYRIRAIYEDKASEWGNAKTIKANSKDSRDIINLITNTQSSLASRTQNSTLSTGIETNVVQQSAIGVKISVGLDKNNDGILEWQSGNQDGIVGIPGTNINQFKLSLTNAPTGMRVKYRAYILGRDWQEWKYDGIEAGVIGQSIQAIQVMLEVQGDSCNVVYGAFGTGEQDIFVRNGEIAGSISSNAKPIQALAVFIQENVTKITADTTWKVAQSPIIIKGLVEVEKDVKLTIEPGTKIVFEKYASNYIGIDVYGTLEAKGTSTLPIEFNESETLKSQNLNQFLYDFKPIDVKSSGILMGDYIKLNYKESAVNIGYMKQDAMINVAGALDLNHSTINCTFSVTNPVELKTSGIRLQAIKNININNTTIQNCTTGIILGNSLGNINIKGNVITNNDIGISLKGEPYVIYDENGNEKYREYKTYSPIVNVNDNQINNNNCGIEIYGDNSLGELYLDHNTINDNKEYGIRYEGKYCGKVFITRNTISRTNTNRTTEKGAPIYVNSYAVPTGDVAFFSRINSNDADKNNFISDNSYDAILVDGDVRADELFLTKGSYNYLLDDLYDGAINIGPKKSMTIETGTTINLRGTIWVDGKLNALGGSSSFIVISPVSNSTYGIKHKLAGQTESVRDSYFESIVIGSSGELNGLYTRFINGGKDYGRAWITFGAIESQGKINLVGCEILNSSSDGINVSEGEVSVWNSTIRGSIKNGLNIVSHQKLKLMSNRVTQNQINGLSICDPIGKETIIFHNSFMQNTLNGIMYIGTTGLNATFNYWGSSSGPGLYGDDITPLNYIAVDHWLTQEEILPFSGQSLENIKNSEYKAKLHFGEEGVSSATGNFSKRFEDFKYDLPGFDLDISRTYNSRDNDSNSVLGDGWRFGLQADIKDLENAGPNETGKTVRFPNGSVASFTKNADGTFTPKDSRHALQKIADGGYLLTTKEQVAYNFNPSGFIRSIKDKKGNVININPDSTGRILSVTSDTGLSLNMVYENGKLRFINETVPTITGPAAGRKIEYFYEYNKLKYVVDVNSKHSEEYYYDTNGRLCRILQNSTEVQAITYYTEEGINKGKVKTEKDAFGNTRTYDYDNFRRRTIVTDLKGRITETYYDTSMYINYVIYPDKYVSIAEYSKDEKGVNKYGEEEYATDKMGYTTHYTRDERGNIIKQELYVAYEVKPITKEFTYDGKNNLTSEKDESGRCIYYIYDDAKVNLIKKVQPLNGTDVYSESTDPNYLKKFAITTYTYYSDAEAASKGYKVKGLLKSEVDPMNNTTIYSEYDARGNVKKIINPESKIALFDYNKYSQKETVTSPKGYRTVYSYDNKGNVIKVVQNGDVGEVSNTRIVYDNFGRNTKEISPNQYNIADDINDYAADYGQRYTYYPSGKIKSTTDAVGNVTTYTYDLYGNKETEAKPNNSKYRYTYDEGNRLEKVYFTENLNSPEILLEENSYSYIKENDNGRMLLQHDQKKYISDTQYIKYTFIFDNQKKFIEQRNNDGTSVKYGYNNNGTLEYKTDELGYTTYYYYDGLNRQNKVLTPFEVSGGKIKYNYKSIEYDKCGNKIKESIIKTPVEKNADEGFYASFPRITKEFTYYRDGKLHTEYDNEGRMIEYFYDDDGVLSKQVTTVDKVGTKNTVEYINNYLQKPKEKINHVAKGDIENNTLTDRTDIAISTIFTYDKNGNVKTEKDPYGNTVTYLYDNLNRQTDKIIYDLDETNAPNTKITTSKKYNWLGKELSITDGRSNTTTFNYNQAGLLSTITSANGETTTYQYDRAGRKTAEITPQNLVEYNKWMSALSTYYNQTVNTVNSRYDLNKDNIIDIFDMVILSKEGANRTEFLYDTMGRLKLKKEVFRNKDTLQWEGFVSQAYQYDKAGNVIKSLGALGYEAGTGGEDEKISSGYGEVFTYNLAGKLETALDPVSKDRLLNFTNKYEYDAIGRSIRETDADGNVISYEYNNSSKVLSKSIRFSGETTVNILEKNEYDLCDNLIRHTDGNNNITTYEYNAFNSLRKLVTPGDATIPVGITSYQYDKNGKQKVIVDPKGLITKVEYNARGNVLSEEKSDILKTNIIKTYSRYDANGNKRYQVDGNKTEFETLYDPFNRVKESKVTVTDINLRKITKSTVYEYDANGNKVREKDWLNNTTTFVYDNLYRLASQIDANGKVVQKLEYYKDGTQSKSYDAYGQLTTYEYDRNKRLLKVVDPALKFTSQNYDNKGNISEKKDGRGNVTKYQYDGLNRLKKVINAKLEETSYTYDLNGNMLTQKDGNNYTTTFEYNVANKLTKRIDNNGRSGVSGQYVYNMSRVESYTYDENAKLLTTKDRKGITKTNTYDIFGRIKKEQTTLITIGYDYDYNGNNTKITDSTGTTDRTFDELGRVTSKTVTGMGKMLFLYDNTVGIESGCYQEITTDPKGNVVKKTFDKVGRLKSVEADAKVTSYIYYDNGNKKSILYPNGTKEEYTYYPNNTIKVLTNYKNDGTILEQFSYTYDDAKNIYSKTEQIATTIYTTNYTYDQLNRIETISNNTCFTKYTYDAAGNRLTEEKRRNDGTESTTYKYNDQNRLDSSTATFSSTTTFSSNNPYRTDKTYSYDENGNQCSEKIVSYTKRENSDYMYSTYNTSLTSKSPEELISKNYERVKYQAAFLSIGPSPTATIITKTNNTINSFDQLNRLTESNISTKIEERDYYGNVYYTPGAFPKKINHFYNGEGLRIEKQIDGISTEYLYEGDKVILETDGTGQQKAKTVYGTNAVSRTVTSSGSAKTAYYMFNGHGDVTKMVDTNNAVAADYSYDEFGTLTTDSGTMDNPIRYAGYLYDKEVGTYYLISRMYNPTTARFLQEDTYRGNPKDPLSLNLYTYCINNPLIYNDPSGHFFKELWSGIKSGFSRMKNSYVGFADEVHENFGRRRNADISYNKIVYNGKLSAESVVRNLKNGTDYVGLTIVDVAMQTTAHPLKALAATFDSIIGAGSTAKYNTSRTMSSYVEGTNETYKEKDEKITTSVKESYNNFKNDDINTKILKGTEFTLKTTLLVASFYSPVKPVVVVDEVAADSRLLSLIEKLEGQGSKSSLVDDVLSASSKGITQAEGKIKVPTVKSGEFNDWFNSLSVDELDSMWQNKSTRRAIERQLREPGGMHEWHLVSRAPQFKNWGVSAEQIRDLRTAISDVEFINPVGKHGQLGSTAAHNELLGIIDSSIDYNMFTRRLNNWANYRINGGVDALPEGLKLK